MSQQFDKLKTLLKELFQLDQPDLDFGFYRVMHARSADITQFLETDLLPQVKDSLAQYQPADKAAIEKELAKVVAGIEAAGMNPEDSPKVKELRAKLEDDAVDLDALEAEVYDHLYSFFRRYYSEGDFLSKRVYKPGVYAIPYEGEEVKLHWANADQYYIKTSEYLRDYAFRLRPDDDNKPMRVRFQMVDAAEGEHGNVKEQAGRERRFKLAPAPFAGVEDGELVIRFTYQPDPEKRKQGDLNAAAAAAILGLEEPALADWIKGLRAKHVRADGTASDATRLRVHLDRYTARNTFDYFIHKDLGGFLRRELDFYIKNEVMHLDDVENESASRVEQYLSKITVIRRIAGKIIAFLAQLEDFQKKLWLKRKFVVETSYCIRLGVIPEEFYPEIAANDAQRDEWVRLCAIDEITGDLTTPGYSVPLALEFLKARPTLVIDTQHFDASFRARLLEAVGDVDAQTDGLLIHGENFQALWQMQAAYREQIKCIYIDPPYNKGGNDDFAYKDNYQHSSWLAMILDRLKLARSLLRHDGVVFASIDDHEVQNLARAFEETSRFGAVHLVPAITNLKGNYDAEGFVAAHEYVTTATVGPLSSIGEIPVDEEALSSDWSEDEYGYWKQGDGLRRTGADAARERRPNGWFPVFIQADGTVYVTDDDQPVSPDDRVLWPVNGEGEELSWTWSKAKISREPQNLLVGGPEAAPVVYKKQRASIGDIPTRKPKSFLYAPGYSSTTGGNVLTEIMGARLRAFTPKSVDLLADLTVLGSGPGDLICDFFAGSGTLGHAAIQLSRQGVRRSFVLVEQADHFDSVLLPRLKKVTYTADWKDGKPRRIASAEEARLSPRIMKVIRLESYEDTLNNLDLRRTNEQQSLLELSQAQGADKLKEQYLLRYMLDVETRGSQSLLNVAAFTDPTAYKLKVKRPGSDESREVNVDLLETFNWLIGLTVQHIAAPQTFAAEFERDGEGRLRLKGRLKQEADGPWWFRTVKGVTPDSRKTLVIWRKRPGGEAAECIEQDNLVLDEWFTKQGYSSKDSEFDLIYVNGDNNLENLKVPDDTWKVRLIEEDFFRLMFEAEGV